MHRALVGLMVAAAGFAGVARADPPPDKGAYSLFNPTPASALRSLCTDRPTKGNGPCSVDAGHWQIESDIYNVTFQHAGGIATTTELFTNPTLKLGITDTLDLEVAISPYERVTARAAGVTTTASGAGDLFLIAKLNLVGDDGGNLAVALNPWVKIPTAGRVIGNGAVEAGMIVPAQYDLPGGLQIYADPELDVLENAAGGGQHPNLINDFGLSAPASRTVTLFGEVWTDADFDPAGPVTQVSADVAAAWIPASMPNLQLDGGVNLGLDQATPGAQVYVGVSRRF